MRVVHIGEREWEVFVEWEGRKPLHRAFRLLRFHRESRAHRRDRRRKNDGNWWDALEVVANLGDLLDDFAFIALVIATIALIVFGGSWVAVVLLGLVELFVIVALALLGVLGRTVLGRPWRVAAVSDEGHVWAWRQIGFLAARRLAHRVADELELGRPPSSVHVDQLESLEPIQLTRPANEGVPGSMGASVLFASVAVLALIGAIVLNLVLWF